MNKNRVSKYLILVATSTFLAIFFFIVQNSYAKLIGPIREAQNSSLAKPINPRLDVDTLDFIESREEYLENATVDTTLITPSDSPPEDQDFTTIDQIPNETRN